MRYLIILIVLLQLFIGMPTHSLFAEDLTLKTGALKNYVWRGWNLTGSAGFINASITGDMYDNYYSAGIEGIFDTGNTQMQYYNLNISYIIPFDKQDQNNGMILGGAYYKKYFNEDIITIFTGIKYNIEYDDSCILVEYLLIPDQIAFYYDFGSMGSGAYLQLQESCTLIEKEKNIVGLKANLGVAVDNGALGRNSEGETFSDFYDADISAFYKILFTDDVVIVFSGGYAFYLSEDARVSIEKINILVDNDATTFYAGVFITFTFPKTF